MKCYNYLLVQDSRFDFEFILRSTNLTRALWKGRGKAEIIEIDHNKALLVDSNLTRKEIEERLEFYNYDQRQRVELAKEIKDNKCLLTKKKNHSHRKNKKKFDPCL